MEVTDSASVKVIVQSQSWVPDAWQVMPHQMTSKRSQATVVKLAVLAGRHWACLVMLRAFCH